MGKYVDQQLCDEIISGHENRTIFSDNYKNLHCNISSELDRLKRELLSCHSNLTAELIEDMIASENADNLERIEALVKSFNSDNFKLFKKTITDLLLIQLFIKF